MLNNPFASKTYETIWLKHFSNGAEATTFGSVKGVKFVKHSKLPYYENIGRNLTNGMTYQLDLKADDLKGRVVVVYDVPDYFSTESYDNSSNIKVNKIKQYKGLSSNLDEFESLEDVLQSCFGSKSKSRFKGRVRQIESSFNISQKVYFGSISKEEYKNDMRTLKELLFKRFDQRNEHNTVLPIWSFYEELIYDLILEKKVVFNVIYDESKPIAMSINYVYDHIVVVAIRTFDIEYYKYNIGNYEVYKLFDWSLQNGISELDFSKGEVDYKRRWSNREYTYEHHIIYNSKSLKAVLIGKSLSNLLKFKQYLRDKKVNTMYVKLKHLKKKILFQK